VVGTGEATQVLKDGETVTVSCAEGDTGMVYAGRLAYTVETLASETLPAPPVKLMMNVGNPERAFEFAQIPNHGVGLARLEFIIARMIGIHPLALLDCAGQPPAVRARSMRARQAMPIRCRFTWTSWPRASPPWRQRSGRSR